MHGTKGGHFFIASITVADGLFSGNAEIGGATKNNALACTFAIGGA